MKPYAPFVAFVCGFGFDSFTLGQSVDPIDLFLVTCYALGAFAGMVACEFELPGVASRIAALVLQFALGGSLSALVVLYFKSSGQPLSIVLVLVVFGIALVNEIKHIDEPPQREWVVTIWAIAATMLGNFVIPHAVGSVSSIWFYVSAAVVAAALIVLRLALSLEWRSLRFAFGGLAVLLTLWILGLVPPVPLVLRNQLVCTDYAKQGGEYTCMVAEPTLLQRIGLSDPTIARTDEPVYYLSSVFAPDAVGTVIEHRWYRWGEDGWKRTDEMSFEMTGGRPDGWRVWSRKRTISPGEWKVETALQGGGVVGSESFYVVDGSAKKSRTPL